MVSGAILAANSSTSDATSSCFASIGPAPSMPNERRSHHKVGELGLWIYGGRVYKIKPHGGGVGLWIYGGRVRSNHNVGELGLWILEAGDIT